MHRLYLTKLGVIIIDACKNSNMLFKLSSSVFINVPHTLYNLFNDIDHIETSLSIQLYDDGAFEAGCDYPDKSIEKNIVIQNLDALYMYLIDRKGLMESLNIFMEGPGWMFTMVKTEDIRIVFKDGSSKKYEFDDFISIYNLNYFSH